MIGLFPEEKLTFIHKIQSKTPCYLLSNTNELHLKKVYTNVHSDFESLFQKCYYSHVIGKRKPDVQTFQWLVNQIKFKASEILRKALEIFRKALAIVRKALEVLRKALEIL